MIRAGDLIENPATGERLLFHATSADTGGEYVLVECSVEPGGGVAAAHVHPFQTERFEVLEGAVAFRAGRTKVVAGPGEVVTVEPGTPHRFENVSAAPARFLCEVRPALQFEAIVETMFGLAAEGKTNSRGMPSPLRLAVIANEHFDDVRLPYVPHFLQKAALVAGAAVGRLAGYRPAPHPASGPALAGA
jgi:quercetin dioxygenase-like cupin family protein